jgi:hypothetical protein
MSTKIYNGYKIKSKNFQILHDFAIHFRDKARKIHEKQIKWYYASLAVGFHDDKKFRGINTQTNNTPAYHAWREISNRQIEIVRTNKRDPFVDIYSSLTIAPAPNARHSLARLFTENTNVRKAFEDHPLITPYPYWDNTDKPDEIPEAEWDKRAKDWDRIIGYEPAATCMFSIEVFGKYQTTDMALPNTETLQKMFPIENRIKALLNAAPLTPKEIQEFREKLQATIKPITVEDLQKGLLCHHFIHRAVVCKSRNHSRKIPKAPLTTTFRYAQAQHNTNNCN